jgi:hypothetical protein
VIDGVSHVLPLQQPDVHVCEQPSQTLFTHAVPFVHVAHAAPPEPHAPATLPGWQTLFSQQPPGQPVALHTHEPFTHARPAPHAALLPHLHTPPPHESAYVGSHVPHAPPAEPHVASDGALHVDPLQHPFAHDVASQTHWPPTQRWPDAHAAFAPHVHAPLVHASALVASHATHAPPADPHAVVEFAVHALPLQQPLGHEVALHTH